MLPLPCEHPQSAPLPDHTVGPHCQPYCHLELHSGRAPPPCEWPKAGEGEEAQAAREATEEAQAPKGATEEADEPLGTELDAARELAQRLGRLEERVAKLEHTGTMV